MADTPPSSEHTSDLPSPVELVSITMTEFMDQVGPMAMLGLAQFLSVMVAMVVILPLSFCCLYGCMAGTAGLGAVVVAALESMLGEGGGALGAVFTMFGMVGSIIAFYVFLLGGFAVVVAPVMGGVMRALDKHLRGIEEATLGGAFAGAKDQPVKDILSSFLFGLSIVLGMLFCYVGMFVPAFLLMWFNWACEVDGLSIRDGLSRSVRHVRDNLSWSLTVFVVGFAVNMVAAYIPILGPMFALAFMIRCYRAAFPAPESSGALQAG